MPATALPVGALVLDAADPYSPHALRVVVGHTEAGAYLTSYLNPPPWLEDAPPFFTSAPDELHRAPPELLHELPADEAAAPPLRSWLGRLRSLAEAPLAPGQSGAWAARLATAWPGFVAAWRHARTSDAGLARQVIETDPALQARLERSLVRAAELDDRLEELRRRVLCAASPAPAPAPNPSAAESPDEARAHELRCGLISWTVAARELGAELRQVLVEAHYRDRGFSA